MVNRQTDKVTYRSSLPELKKNRSLYFFFFFYIKADFLQFFLLFTASNGRRSLDQPQSLEYCIKICELNRMNPPHHTMSQYSQHKPNHTSLTQTWYYVNVQFATIQFVLNAICMQKIRNCGMRMHVHFFQSWCFHRNLLFQPRTSSFVISLLIGQGLGLVQVAVTERWP